MGNTESSPSSEEQQPALEPARTLDTSSIDDGQDAEAAVVVDVDNAKQVASPPPLASDDKNDDTDIIIHTETHRSPSFFCCCQSSSYWHPTHAEITIDGQRFAFNARAHRKMRHVALLAKENDDVDDAGIQYHGFPRLWCWEPRIVTWYICWIGVIANSLWVINGVWATWPELLDANAEMITYNTGVIGAFLFIVTGYLGYVEAINHTHSNLHLPSNDDDDKQKSGVRQFLRPVVQYGRYFNPIVPHHYQAHNEQEQLIAQGYPLIQSVETKQLLTHAKFESLAESNSSNKLEQEELQTMLMDIRIGSHVIRVQPLEIKHLDPQEQALYSQAAAEQDNAQETAAFLPHNPKTTTRRLSGYRWWTWQPDLRHIGIANALIFLIATILFFLPACLWYPMAENGATLAGTIFWVYVLQMIPSVAFIYVGWAGMAEVSGSWVKTATNDIGWWIAFFNMLGGWGFLLYPILYLPTEVHGGHDELAKWGAALATFWGSCFFWIAGILECIEFSSRHPIKILK